MPDTYYATINAEGVCSSTIQYTTVLDEIPAEYIPIESDEMTTILGYTYDDGDWIAPPEIEVVYPPP
jgi:hypothetical protein